ncbi:MAG: dihydrofolate reductase family protein [Solobacterium sp.]|nr:dihydrofolate reductase family protein [Solobacterium sp.]
MERPVTTLFMLMSADGKISTGASDALDVDADFPKIAGLREGLHQYYEIEQTTDLWALNTGRVQAKLGVNHKDMPQKTPVSFVLLDNSHLQEHGVRWFCARSREFVLVTQNPAHPAFGVEAENLHIILQKKLDLMDALCRLKKEFGCDRLTVQSGGTINSYFVREDLLDYIDLVIAPVLIGGKDTATLVDGASFTAAQQLSRLGILQLEECIVLDDSYLRLRYRVIHREKDNGNDPSC